MTDRNSSKSIFQNMSRHFSQWFLMEVSPLDPSSDYAYVSWQLLTAPLIVFLNSDLRFIFDQLYPNIISACSPTDPEQLKTFISLFFCKGTELSCLIPEPLLFLSACRLSAAGSELGCIIHPETFVSSALLCLIYCYLVPWPWCLWCT